jgi:hypothetical protein
MRLRLRFLGVLPPAMLVTDPLWLGASTDDRLQADDPGMAEPADRRSA